MATVVIPPTASPDLSFADLRKMAANNWEEPAAAPAADPTPAAAPPAPPAETPAVETQPPASEPVKPQEPTPNGEPAEPTDEAVPPGVQKRIDKAIKKQRDAERRVAELESRLQQTPQATPPAQPTAQPAATPPSTDAAPDPAKYTNWDQYQQDLTNWTIDQRQKREQAAQQQRTHQERGQALTQSWHASEDAARAKHADYEDVIAGVKDVQVPQHLQMAIFESQGQLAKADLAYALAKNRKELERIVALPASQGILELGAFIAGHTRPPAPQTATAAPPLPKPPSSVGGSGAAAPAVDLSTCDMRTFKREMRKQLSGE